MDTQAKQTRTHRHCPQYIAALKAEIQSRFDSGVERDELGAQDRVGVRLSTGRLLPLEAKEDAADSLRPWVEEQLNHQWTNSG